VEEVCSGQDKADMIINEIRALEKENLELRAIIAKSVLPCLYCGLTDISKCTSGFPGCGRMDDIINDPRIE
jgi:hypothetical protein